MKDYRVSITPDVQMVLGELDSENNRTILLVDEAELELSIVNIIEREYPVITDYKESNLTSSKNDMYYIYNPCALDKAQEDFIVMVSNRLNDKIYDKIYDVIKDI